MEGANKTREDHFIKNVSRPIVLSNICQIFTAYSLLIFKSLSVEIFLI